MRHSSLVITGIVFAIAVVCPVLGRSDGKYFTVVYASILLWAASRPFPRPAAVPALYLFILTTLAAAILHVGDAGTFVNAGSVSISVIALAGLAYYCIKRYGAAAVDVSLEKALWICLVSSFVLSIALTATGVSFAPNYFPWEAFYSKARLLLIDGHDVGHTPSLWLLAFVSVFTLHRMMQARRIRWGLVTLLALLAMALLATKSRLAIIYIVNLLVMGLAYKRVTLMRAMVLVFPLLFSIGFLTSTMVPGISDGIGNIAARLQKGVGSDVRITASENGDATILAGRGVLNRALLEASLRKPFVGLGSRADILLHGVDSEGNIAYDNARRVAGTESVLRLAVKFGWPYLASVGLFLFSVPFYMRELSRTRWILKAGLWGMCIECIVSEGGMEVYYGVSGLFLFILCLIVFEHVIAKSKERQKVLRGCGERALLFQRHAEGIR